LLVAAVGGFFSAPVWNFFGKRLGWNETEIDRLRKEITRLGGQHQTCEDKVRELTERIAVIEHHHSSAFARWLSDAGRRIVYVNSKALISIFGPMGLTREQVEGKTFHDFIEPNVAAELDELAQAALARDGSAVSNLIKLHPDLPVMHVVKIAAAGRDGGLIYEAIAFRMNDPDIVLGIGVARNAAQRISSIDSLAGPKAAE
jgi:hypothetical protein